MLQLVPCSLPFLQNRHRSRQHRRRGFLLLFPFLFFFFFLFLSFLFLFFVSHSLECVILWRALVAILALRTGSGKGSVA